MSQPLEEIQDRIVEQLHAGEELDQAAILAAHPEHAEALKGFFRVLELVENGAVASPAAPSRLGEFQILRELGRGGMGVVYEAEQLSLKRRVALKVLPPALGHDARLKARFQREAEAAGRLRHPGIVPVISFGDVAGTPFFAMELVEGRSLARVLAELREGRDGGVPPAGEERRRWALGIAIAVAEALAYAHAQGIVHRDVKPGNILLGRQGEPRLSDFGLAQDLGMEGLTTSGESFGSPRYMSPEQAFRRKLPVDQRSDIYSLGVTLYEMLTLRYPYEGATSVEYMNELSQGRVVPPRKADASIPAALESVLLRALAKDPAQRYADASAFAEDLKAVLEKRALARETRASRPWHKRRALRLVAAVLLLSALACGLWLWEESTRRHLATNQLAGGMRSVIAGERSLYSGRVDLRSFVSRKEPGTYVCTVALPPASSFTDGWKPSGRWSYSIDGGGWMPLPAEAELVPGAIRWRVPLQAVLGKALANDSVRVRHRLDEFSLSDGQGLRREPVPQPTEFSQTVFVYDELPADYPEAVSSLELDQRMRALVTPESAQFHGTSSLEGGRKAIQVGLGLPFEALPAPVAGELELYRPGEEQPFARGRLVCPAEEAPASSSPIVIRMRPDVRLGNVTWLTSLFRGPQPIDFVLEPMAAEKEVQLLLDLQQGRMETVRVVFEPSRTVARESSSFDRYWNGSIDVVVPLTSTPADGR
jgi:serine/threonine protein kinase